MFDDVFSDVLNDRFINPNPEENNRDSEWETGIEGEIFATGEECEIFNTKEN